MASRKDDGQSLDEYNSELIEKDEIKQNMRTTNEIIRWTSQ
jgi:hypothetical protein